jgi:hypothetical protein
MTVTVKSSGLWDITPYRLVEIPKFLQNLCKRLPYYTASHDYIIFYHIFC